MKKAPFVLIVVAILVAALALTGCGSPKASAEKPAPESVSGTISETIVPEEESNKFGLEDGKFEGEDPGVEWEEFQREGGQTGYRDQFQNATGLRDATRFAHQDGDRTKRASRLARWQNARLLTQHQGTDFQSAIPWPVGWRGRYQDAMRPPPGISVWIVPWRVR